MLDVVGGHGAHDRSALADDVDFERLPAQAREHETIVALAAARASHDCQSVGADLAALARTVTGQDNSGLLDGVAEEHAVTYQRELLAGAHNPNRPARARTAATAVRAHKTLRRR